MIAKDKNGRIVVGPSQAQANRIVAFLIFYKEIRNLVRASRYREDVHQRDELFAPRTKGRRPACQRSC